MEACHRPGFALLLRCVSRPSVVSEKCKKVRIDPSLAGSSLLVSSRLASFCLFSSHPSQAAREHPFVWLKGLNFVTAVTRMLSTAVFAPIPHLFHAIALGIQRVQVGREAGRQGGRAWAVARSAAPSWGERSQLVLFLLLMLLSLRPSNQSYFFSFVSFHLHPLARFFCCFPQSELPLTLQLVTLVAAFVILAMILGYGLVTPFFSCVRARRPPPPPPPAHVEPQNHSLPPPPPASPQQHLLLQQQRQRQQQYKQEQSLLLLRRPEAVAYASPTPAEALLYSPGPGNVRRNSSGAAVGNSSPFQPLSPPTSSLPAAKSTPVGASPLAGSGSSSARAMRSPSVNQAQQQQRTTQQTPQQQPEDERGSPLSQSLRANDDAGADPSNASPDAGAGEGSGVHPPGAGRKQKGDANIPE